MLINTQIRQTNVERRVVAYFCAHFVHFPRMETVFHFDVWTWFLVRSVIVCILYVFYTIFTEMTCHVQITTINIIYGCECLNGIVLGNFYRNNKWTRAKTTQQQHQQQQNQQQKNQQQKNVHQSRSRSCSCYTI